MRWSRSARPSTGVDGVRVGDQVAVDPSLYCGECYFCQRGRGNMCERWAGHRRDGHRRRRGVRRGAGGELRGAARDIRPADAALIEPLSCAVHGFDVLAPTMGDHYLIYGAGTMGLMMMELAKRAGAASVSMVDLNPARLETARELAARPPWRRPTSSTARAAGTT